MISASWVGKLFDGRPLLCFCRQNTWWIVCSVSADMCCSHWVTVAAANNAPTSTVPVFGSFCLPTTYQAATCFDLLLLYVLYTVYCLQVVHKSRSIHWLKEEKGRKKIKCVALTLNSITLSKLAPFSSLNLVSTYGQTSDDYNESLNELCVRLITRWVITWSDSTSANSCDCFSSSKAFKKQQDGHRGSSLPVQRENQHGGDGGGKCGRWHGWVSVLWKDTTFILDK